jgi:hypothetical protein
MKSAFVNLYRAFVENETTSIVGGKEEKKRLAWYDMFQVGMDHHMGVQDYGLSREAVVALQEMWEREWTLAGTSVELRLEVVQLACFLFLGYQD